MKLELAKGVKDIDPKNQIVREKVLTILKEVFSRYGFNPLDTPVIERLSLFESKGSGGSEIMKEVFKFKDQGERELGLRFDLTVPFCRYVGMNPNLKMPFKRYQIGKVFRDGPIKLGRYREFYQCDVDVVGTKSMVSDAEILALAREAFEKLGLDVNIYMNNRKVLDGIMEYLNIEEEKRMPVILSVDKLEKIGQTGVEKELLDAGLSMDTADKLFELLTLSGNNEEKISYLKKYLGDNEGLKEIEEILGYVPSVVFDPTLARGFDYYTGPVFEVFLRSKEMERSLAAGGRYDKMIGKFLGREEEYPAMGISFGLDTICDTLKILNKVSEVTTTVELFVVPIKTAKECFSLTKNLRSEGINVDMDLIGRGVSKNLDYADKYKIPFALFVGGQELMERKYKLKNMETGKEEMLDFGEVIARVKNARC
jgi:histidyl-tRNA synthetase